MKLTKWCGRANDDSQEVDLPSVSLCASMMLGLGLSIEEVRRSILNQLSGHLVTPILETIDLAKPNDPIILLLREREESVGAAIVLVENLSKKKALDSLYKDLERTEAQLKAHGREPQGGL